MWRPSDENGKRVLSAILRAVVPVLCLGCSDAGEPPSDEPIATPGLDPSAPAVGSFAVTLVAPTSSTDGFTSVLGRVYDAPRPDELGWEIAAAAQGCQLRI